MGYHQLPGVFKRLLHFFLLALSFYVFCLKRKIPAAKGGQNASVLMDILSIGLLPKGGHVV